MSTRKLILAALACGLAILIAGGIQLITLSGKSKDADAIVLAEGTTATVGGQAVAVLSHAIDETTLRLTVKSTSADGWGLITDTGSPVPRGATTCDAGECRLDFDLQSVKRTPKSYVAVLSSGGQSASWSVK